MEQRKLNRVLIANRGEIAIRIIRTVKMLGLAAIAIYETPDKDAYGIRFADEALHIGEGPNKDYLDIDKIIGIAKKHNIDAIHPGCGFLSESVAFATACERNGIVFIGPQPNTLKILGDKVSAKSIAQIVGAPTIPCTGAILPDEQGIAVTREFVSKNGYPVIVKSLFGGGGRGIRKVDSDNALRASMLSASAEATNAFGDGHIYIEKYISHPKHIEVQILADSFGNTIHLGTRDCSIQRRHQKLIEVAPADLPASTLDRLQTVAIEISKQANYTSAGTVEFLVDAKTQDFWFLEVNCRLQVEHTITEMLTDIDIVEQQIRIAAGEQLSIKQEHISLDGIAIEVRINAEDPKKDFAPDGGKFVEIYTLPGGPAIRVDSAVYRGYRVPTCYDSLLAKLIVKGYQWEQTVRRLKRSLNDFTLAWPKTTIPLYIAICDEPDFKSRNYSIDYIDTHPEIFNYPDPEYYVVDNCVYKTDRTNCIEETCPLGKKDECRVALRSAVPTTGATIKQGAVRSTIKGKVVKILVELGNKVDTGDHLVELEAMKMHTFISAPNSGIVADIFFEEGDSVDVGDAILTIETNG